MSRRLIPLFVIFVIASSACTSAMNQGSAEAHPAGNGEAAAESEDAIRTVSMNLLTIEERREQMLGSIAKRLGTGSGGFVATAFGRLMGDALLSGRTAETDHGTSLPELLADLTLLDAPRELQPVRNLLVTASLLELQAAASNGECTSWVVREDFGIFTECERHAQKVHPTVNFQNLDKFHIGDRPGRIDPIWATAQRMRGKAYERWAQILREHGFDPCDAAGICGSE